MAKKSDYNFKDCLYNPFEDKFLTNIQSIREFGNYQGKLPKKKLFTWIVVMYDLNSPLRKTITNYYERKKLAAEVAGWTTNRNGEFDEDVNSVLLGTDKQVNSLIVSYLVQFSMPEYLQLVAYLNMSYTMARDAMENLFEKDTAKTLDFITDKVKSLTNAIYGSGQYDEVMAARKALYEMAEKERIKLNPESIVKLITEEGGLPKEFNPYGSTYKPDKITFHGDEA